jgi:tetratricopeptide (TPR) repeat protein
VEVLPEFVQEIGENCESDSGDATRLISVLESALDEDPNPKRQAALRHLMSVWPYRRFSVSDDTQDLIRAIETSKKAVTANPEKAVYKAHLAATLGRQYIYTGCLIDLDLAIQVVEEAYEMRCVRNINGSSADLYNLSLLLFQRVRITGEEKDTDRYIEIPFQYIKRVPPNTENYIVSLRDYSNFLLYRFERGRAQSDLDSAFAAAKLATDMAQPHCAATGSVLANAANFADWSGLRSAGKLAEITDYFERPIVATPRTSQEWPVVLAAFGAFIFDDVSTTDEISDQSQLRLQKASELLEQAVGHQMSKLQAHRELPVWLKILCRLYSPLFSLTDILESPNSRSETSAPRTASLGRYGIDRAWSSLWQARLESNGVEVWGGEPMIGVLFSPPAFDYLQRLYETTYTEMLDFTPPENPERAAACTIAIEIALHPILSRLELGSAQKILELAKMGWQAKNSLPVYRVFCGRLVVKISYRKGSGGLTWVNSSAILAEAVELLPTISPRAYNNTEREKSISTCRGLAYNAAASALKAEKPPTKTLKTLEAGRDFITGLLLEIYVDVSDLELKHPGIAKEFIQYRDILDNSLSDGM